MPLRTQHVPSAFRVTFARPKPLVMVPLLWHADTCANTSYATARMRHNYPEVLFLLTLLLSLHGCLTPTNIASRLATAETSDWVRHIRSQSRTRCRETRTMEHLFDKAPINKPRGWRFL